MASECRREYKVLVVGAEGVGKTSFKAQFIMGVIPESYDPTTEDSWRKLTVVDNEAALVDVSETARGEEYSPMREQYLRTCEGMIIMYSITNRETFERVPMFRDRLLHMKDKDHFPMLIVGNQSDQHYDRAVLTQEGMAVAMQTGCGFLEASARGNYNVERAFHDIVREIRRYDLEHSSFLAMPSNLPLTPRKKSPFFLKNLSMSSLMKLFKLSK